MDNVEYQDSIGFPIDQGNERKTTRESESEGKKNVSLH